MGVYSGGRLEMAKLRAVQKLFQVKKKKIKKEGCYVHIESSPGFIDTRKPELQTVKPN